MVVIVGSSDLLSTEVLSIIQGHRALVKKLFSQSMNNYNKLKHGHMTDKK